MKVSKELLSAEGEIKSIFHNYHSILANSLKILSKKCRRVTYCLSLKAIQVLKVCFLACLSDYQDYFNY